MVFFTIKSIIPPYNNADRRQYVRSAGVTASHMVACLAHYKHLQCIIVLPQAV